MKRHSLKRSSIPLKRSTIKSRRGLSPRREGYAKDNLQRNSTLARVGVKMRKKLSGVNGYTAFSRALRQARPHCEIRWEMCLGKTQGVHHVIKRSHGGALIPGVLADMQGQEFMSACNPCNLAIEDYPARAKAEGFSKSNPVRPGSGRGRFLEDGFATRDEWSAD